MYSVPGGSDSAVQATNDEALVAKLSAVQRGYFKDPYISALCDALSSPMSRSFPARQPMINRGTYARVSLIRLAVGKFLSAMQSQGPVQIVSLGAGHDTLPFNILSECADARLRYIELDFAEVIRGKVDGIASSPKIASLFKQMTRVGDGVRATTKNGAIYVASPCDLRNLEEVRDVLQLAGIDFSTSTVFIAECVLVYMRPTASDDLIRMASTQFSGVRAFANYEPIMPNDPFGRQMVLNISMRGSPLLGITKYPTTKDQRQRFIDASWSDVDALSMLDAFGSVLDAEDVKRINRIEMLDEVEEWRLMMSHYCVVWARSAPKSQVHLLEKIRL
jgi:tRNA wybutosine-synthesizing protein 4